MEIFKDIKLPKSWKDVSVSQFQELSSFDQDADWVDKMIFNTSVLLDIDPDQIEKLEVNKARTLFKSLAWSNVPPTLGPDFVKIDVNSKPVKFIFRRNLNKLSFGEWVDLEGLCKDKDKVVINLHKILAIIYRPEKELEDEYDATKASKRSELFLNVSVEEVYHSILFFWLFAAESINSSKDFSWLEKTWMPKMDQIKEVSDKLQKAQINGTGIDGSILFPEETS